MLAGCSGGNMPQHHILHEDLPALSARIYFFLFLFFFEKLCILFTFASQKDDL